MRRLADRCPQRATLQLTVLACSKGAEVYSILWAIRSARPDLTVQTKAVDISESIIRFAQRGIYSLRSERDDAGGNVLDIVDGTWRDQPLSIFERMTESEVAAMFEVVGDQAAIRPWLKDGTSWLIGDASDSELSRILGPQDIVVANRFLCHMPRTQAESCLRNIGKLVKPGGFVFVSGVDLDVRSKIAGELGWTPIQELMTEIHDGDVSLNNDWPFKWWGLEPFSRDLPDWQRRYASVFQVK